MNIHYLIFIYLILFITIIGIISGIIILIRVQRDKRKFPHPKILHGITVTCIVTLISIITIIIDHEYEFFSAKKNRIILLDSAQKGLVYDEEISEKGEYNSTVISQALSTLPNVYIDIEPTYPTWNREEVLYQQNPDILIIHLSAFYKQSNPHDGDNKFKSFIEYMIKGSKTEIIVYSRLHNLENLPEDTRERARNLLEFISQRKDRIVLIDIKNRSLLDPVSQRKIREEVKKILKL